MPIFMVRVDEELKRKMDDLKEVSWSEVTRVAIEEKVKETEMWRRVDSRRLRLASSETDELRRKVGGSITWNGERCFFTRVNED
jgi:hypothetical protein